jgi:hypothetical protein
MPAPVMGEAAQSEEGARHEGRVGELGGDGESAGWESIRIGVVAPFLGVIEFDRAGFPGAGDTILM